MDFEPIFGAFFDQNGDQSRKRRFYEKPIKTFRTTILLQGLGHAFGGQNPLKNIQKTEWILEGIFDGF